MQDWSHRSLNSLGHFTGGGTPAKNNSEFWNGDVLWITPKDMKSREIRDSKMKITEEGVAGSSAKLIPPNSILVVARSGILRHSLPVCINRIEATVNQDIKAFLPGDDVIPEYVQYLLEGHQSYILSELVKSGVTVESLKYNEFQNHEFPVPPLDEQKRIVAKLDALFTRIDAAITHLQQTLELSKALFASALKAKVLSEGNNWPSFPLNSLGEFSGGGTPAKSKPDFWGGEVLWITPKDMKFSELSDSEMKITPLGVTKSSAKMLPANSVLIVARSGILRHTLPVCISRVEATVNQDIKVFIPNQRVSPEYMQYLLKGNESFILQQLIKGGVTVESLKYKEFQSHSFPIPSIEEQKQIVTYLDALSESIRALEAATKEKLNDFTTLKASLLDAAFKGQL
jgi:type I restriction enzyme S subunit